ncbi:MAG: RecQ family ATP-dependent DNA helicase [Candidatus Kapabacteria bacterium]|nr:RecQ family ATP-dependent DNA helicase [Candidatus Kapabacteria bacterium]
MFERARSILRDVFGHADFRDGQADLVRAVLSGRDVVGVLPTGGGKSLCYQIPALIFPHVTLVISPLIALMQDQTQRLAERGIAAASLHSGLQEDQINAILRQAQSGKLKLLYVAPERLESDSFRRALQPIPLSLVAVDEAHCVSEWGHDFRPSYRRIPSIFDHRSRVPIVALTATATPDVRRDISTALSLRDPLEIVRGFHRPNLTFNVEPTASKVEYITRRVRSHPAESIIVYCGSRRRVETVADELRKRGVGVQAYHAGLPPERRSDVQEQFISGAVDVLVATNAFGMGIDKANVRAVIHCDLTQTLEAYYQEAGRAGRDGKAAECVLLYQSEDRRLMDFFIAGTYPEPENVRAVYGSIAERLGVAIGVSSSDPVMADATSIAASLHISVALVNGSLAALERAGLVIRTTAHGQARIQLRTSHARLDSFIRSVAEERRAATELVVRQIRHLDVGSEIDVPLSELLRRSDVAAAELASALGAMHMAQLIRYRPPQSGGGLVVLGPRLAPNELPVDFAAIHERRARANQKLEVMIGYAETRQCKQNYILSYFGDASGMLRCGRCSSCQQQPRHAEPSARQAPIIHAAVGVAWQLRGRFGRHVVADVVRGVLSDKVREYRLDRARYWGAFRDRSRAEVLEAIDEALDRGWLVRSADLYPTIGATEEGLALTDDHVRPLDLRRERPPQSFSPSDDTFDEAVRERLGALVAMRERLSQQAGAAMQALVSDEELGRIARDAPESFAQLKPGAHGSGLFLAQHGKDVLEALRDVRSNQPRAAETPPSTKIIQELLQKNGVTFADIVHNAGMSAATVARTLEDLLEQGKLPERGRLVDEELYTQVLEYVRYHRYAKIRHVREHLQTDTDLPMLRLALAFARRDLSTTGL